MLNAYLSLVALIRKVPGLRGAIWFFRENFHALERRILVGRPVVDGGEHLRRAIETATPYAAGKMGSLEAVALQVYLRRRGKPFCYSSYIRHSLFVNSGVFPQNEETYDQFCARYLSDVSACNALAAWDVAGEAKVFRDHCPQATLITLRSLEPYFSDTPWSKALAGKRVLVISPFAKSIEKQFAKREQLWKERGVLPEFTLMTLRAPLSAGLVNPHDKDWFAAVNRLITEMDFINYDVALIGAGAFSIPLAVHAKQRGKVGVHMGGSLQMLFGVIGKRWRDHKDFKPFVNEAWCAPSPEETPENFKNVEGGCYW
jgi:hypothetical protein